MTRLRVAVVGAGHLGAIHAGLLMQQDDAELVAVVDPDEATRQRVSEATGAKAVRELATILSQIDAAIVAAPTSLHHDLGLQLLAHGKHVLMEKPLATNVVLADSLVREARQNKCILQVGHVERFNPALQAAEPFIGEPKYIEARRLTGFTFRSMDVGVVMDLMIHDLDLILHLVPGEVTKVQALGAAVLGDHEDMAQARLEFSQGCVVNLTASRIAATAERTMSIYCDSMQASIDFAHRSVQIVQPRQDILDQSFRAEDVAVVDRDALSRRLFDGLLRRQSIDVEDGNPIAEEQSDFLSTIRRRSRPQVSGLDGRNAVALAERICASMGTHSWDGSSVGRTGPHAMDQPTVLFHPASPAPARQRRKAG